MDCNAAAAAAAWEKKNTHLPCRPPPTASSLSSHVSSNNSCVICILNVNRWPCWGQGRGREREKKSASPLYNMSFLPKTSQHITCEHASWMTAFLFTDIYPAHPLPRGTQTTVWILSCWNGKKIIISEVNYWISILDFNPLTVPGAWCPASGEPRQSLDSLWRPAERNVQRNGNHNTLRPPRLLLKAFTVHWLRYSTKHW